MFNSFILTESFTNGFSYSIISLLSFTSIICGILVITSKNPIVSVLFLIGLFLSVASYLMTLGLNFIGLSYLLVYVGAVSILFLFILMLINVRVSELTSENSNSIPLAIFIGIFFNLILYSLLPNSINNIIQSKGLNTYNSDNINYAINNYLKGFYQDDLSFVTTHTWDGALAENSHITTIGNVLYTAYPMWLILTSLILLLAMVGAIVITLKQKTV